VVFILRAALSAFDVFARESRGGSGRGDRT
jgi:hypothetical protein